MDFCSFNVQHCLEALTVEQRDLFFNSKMKLNFEKGEVIIKQGFSSSHILFMEDGLAKLDVENDGRNITIKLIPSQTFIGLMCSFVNKSVDFSAVALLPSKVSLIEREVIESFILNNSEFALRLIKHISFSTNELIHDITRLRQKNIEGAVALLLLEFVEIFKNNTFQLPVTRVEIAKMIGYSKESVINTLSAFNRDGLIDISGKFIKIIAEKRLKQIANYS